MRAAALIIFAVGFGLGVLITAAGMCWSANLALEAAL